jgi:sulfopyruvate decarboxylase TPP-binding subunit
VTIMPAISTTHPGAPPTPLSADAMIAALRKAAITHVVIVPDTVQKVFLSALNAVSDIKTIFACTEDEAVGINAGLYATNHRPILSIQNNGLFACLNTIRGIALDGNVPTIMLIGQYGQKPQIMPEASPLRMVRMLEPTLNIWGVPCTWLWGNQDLEALPGIYEQARRDRGPAALLIPVPTEA